MLAVCTPGAERSRSAARALLGEMRCRRRPRPGHMCDRGRIARPRPSRKPAPPRYGHRARIHSRRRHDLSGSSALGPERTRLDLEVHDRRPWHAGQVWARHGRGRAPPVHRELLDERGRRARRSPRGAGAYRLTATELLALPPRPSTPRSCFPASMSGGRTLPKGHRLSAGEADVPRRRGSDRQRRSPRRLRLAWAGTTSCTRPRPLSSLATAAAGAGIALGIGAPGADGPGRGHRGVLDDLHEGHRPGQRDRTRSNSSPAGNHQPVEAGELVASVKALPHVVDQDAVMEGARLAMELAPLLEVRPYAGCYGGCARRRAASAEGTRAIRGGIPAAGGIAGRELPGGAGPRRGETPWALRTRHSRNSPCDSGSAYC